MSDIGWWNEFQIENWCQDEWDMLMLVTNAESDAAWSMLMLDGDGQLKTYI
jgi:hypothetical protein